MSSSDPEPSYMGHLKKAILRTGFPSELEVDDILQRNGWYARPSTNYVDYDTAPFTQREIDNYALFPNADSISQAVRPVSFSPSLFLDCKKLNSTFAVIMP